MSLGAHTEIERKYDVEPGTRLPPASELTTLLGVADVQTSPTQWLDATYYDTSQLHLVRAGITLRRRAGGEDAGWTLKVPAAQDSRHELTVALGPDDEPVPEELLRAVPAQLFGGTASLGEAASFDEAVRPVARLCSTRQVHQLTDHGIVLALLADDQVRAENLMPPAGARAWREWEVELIDGDLELLDRVEAALLRLGAVRSASTSKLARALGDRLTRRP